MSMYGRAARDEAECEVCTGTFVPKGFYKGWDGSSWCDKCPGTDEFSKGGWHRVCASCVEEFGLLGEAMMGDFDWTWGTGEPLKACPDSDEVMMARALVEPERKVDGAKPQDELKALKKMIKAMESN